MSSIKIPRTALHSRRSSPLAALLAFGMAAIVELVEREASLPRVSIICFAIGIVLSCFSNTLGMERSMLGTAIWRLRMVVNAIILGAIVALIVAFCSAQATRSPVALVPVLIAGGVFGAVAGLIRPDMIEKYGLWFV